MEALTVRHTLANYKFEISKEVLHSFHNQIDTMTVEQKRNALRMVVKKVVWDGENAHVYLMTDPDEDAPELPEPIPSGRVVGILRLDGNPPRHQREVAQITGISRSYVSRIEKRSLKKLRSMLEGG